MPAGYQLRHPHHLVTFRPDGPTFTRRGGGPAWAWQLTAVLAGEVPLPALDAGPVPPAARRQCSTRRKHVNVRNVQHLRSTAPKAVMGYLKRDLSPGDTPRAKRSK